MLEEQIQEMVDRETRAWDAQTLVSIFRPDMLWPWLPTSQTHDPVEWVFSQGRFDRKRGKEGWQELTTLRAEFAKLARQVQKLRGQ